MSVVCTCEVTSMYVLECAVMKWWLKFSCMLRIGVCFHVCIEVTSMYVIGAANHVCH